MILTDELLYNVFHLGANQVGKQFYQDIPMENQLIILNDAQNSWIKSRLGENNIYRKGLEELTKRFHDLNHLVIFYQKALMKKIPDDVYGTYRVNLNENYPEMYYYIDSYCKASRAECKGKKIANTLVEHGELERMYEGEDTQPDFDWEEQLLTFSEGEIKVHTKEYKIDSIHLTYLRYPKRISRKTDAYNNTITWFDGKSFNQDCELPAYAKDEIRDIALNTLAMYTENQILAQTSQQRIANNE